MPGWRRRNQRLPIIGDCSKTPLTRHTQPGTARLQVATSEQVGLVRPPAHVATRAIVTLIPISGQQQAIRRVALPRKRYQAHKYSGIIQPVVDQSPGDRHAVGEFGKSRAALLAREPLRVFEFAVVQADLVGHRRRGEAQH